MKDNTPKLIIFEGIDKVGKTTIHKLFDKTVNYKHLTWDRGLATYISYCLRYNRKIEIDKEYIENSFDIKNTIIVYLFAEKTILEQRYKDTNHEYVNIQMDQSHFNNSLNLLSSYGIKIIKENTSINTPEKTVENIIKKL